MTDYGVWLKYGGQITGNVWQNSSAAGRTFSASIAGRKFLAQNS